MQAREWLRTNGYQDVANMIDEVMNEWKKSGNHTRRNWWDVLAGRAGGKPCIIAGKTFPILRAAQIRQKKPITKNATCRNENEPTPEVKPTGRWSSSNLVKAKE